MTWFATNPSALLPSEVSSGISATADVIGQYLDTARRGLALARLYQQSLGADVPDVLGALIRAIADAVEGLLQAGRVHVLFVPMAKVIAPGGQGPAIPPTLADVGPVLGFSFEEAGLALSGGARDGYARLVGGHGGNAGFFTTFLQSLTDVLDANRPQYDSAKDAVVMTVLMAGAPTFAETIEVAAALDRIFRPPGNTDLTSRTIPTPQNLKAKVIAVPKATRVGVRLEWDAPQARFVLPFFPGVDLRVTRYAVIRSTSATAMAARSVTDFFATRDLEVGTTSGDQAKATQVIAIGSGENASFVDDDRLDPSKTYYYSVAWEVELTENGKTSRHRFDRISNVAKTRTAAPHQTQAAGAPPDWVAHGSLLELVPELSVQAKTMLEQLRVVGERSRGAASRVGRALDLANAQLAASLARVDELSASVKRFAAVLAQPLPSLHATTVEGVGGTAFLIGELAARLSDAADPNRPPFDHDEYVIGLCVVGGGPRLADIKPVTDFLKALFHPAAAANPLLGILAVLDDVVGQQESTLGADLRPLPLNADGTVTLPDGSTVAPDSIDPNTGQPRVVALPVIGEDGTPLDSLHPQNPNAGDTNHVDLGDLC
jgi:hypothetical protein